ncbi:ornithine decarboxylase 1-like isoform X2 [Belonocnema kinseyi]|nr:ornithine decarboxylase 1-like isoform X2 [Belonocnema kinseyi]
MSCLNFKEIRIVDDFINICDIIEEISVSENVDDAFHILNVSEVITRHKLWLSKIPKVVPYYAVFCNSHPTILKVLSELNSHFDCASKEEIIKVQKYGVSAKRINFTNPMKTPSLIAYAKEVGVERMTADCQGELVKIKKFFPEAKVVIRIRCVADYLGSELALKFGCDPHQGAIELINITKDLGLILQGFSFHACNPHAKLDEYARSIRICMKLIDYAKSIGFNDANLIDIGGGIPGEAQLDIDKFAIIINEAIKDIDPSIRFICQPGRYYVTASTFAVTDVIGKKRVIEDKRTGYIYYINDGKFRSFLDKGLQKENPVLLDTITKNRFPTKIWGLTCCSTDLVLSNELLPEFQIGDRLIWKNMGSYSATISTKFNGFDRPIVYPFMRKSDW